ncbi:hypothetical protein GCM10009641_28700 [Mycobacterium cookii]|uniref:Bacterial Ig-like domain-containing protein n=1 Tax=Nocardioides furvisabuli TaxID=375542 RepID=A0ABN2XKF2_9ACTN|nr:Ig-like domain-containing protein [Nocardioides furvisabuli]
MSRSLATASAAVLALAVVPAGPVAASGAPSSTALVLSATESAYGQSVTASARVVSDGGQPQGDVVFAVDDLRIKANLGAGGAATIVLPRLLVGTHAVAATYVPQLPAAQSGSSSSTEEWVVAPARSHLQVQVAGRRTRVATSVRLRVDGDYGTRPAGRVRVGLRRAGVGRVARVGVRLDAGGAAVARLGRLRAGGYRVEVTYVGDSQHRRTRVVGRFRVPRR